jgi:hypothetical protein
VRQGKQASEAPADSINFRYEFDLTRAQLRDEAQIKLEVIAQWTNVTVWINGREATPDDKPKQNIRNFTFPQRVMVNGAPTDDVLRLRSGSNAIAIQVSGALTAEQLAKVLPKNRLLMQARLDAIRRPEIPEGKAEEKVAEEVTEKLVTHRAVVCDLCSNLSSQLPSCVRACPHDAAIRVNARFEFPR